MNYFVTFLFNLVLISCLYAQQQNDVTEQIIQVQLLSRGEAYYLVSQNSYINNDSSSILNQRYEIQLKYTKDDGKTFSLCTLDSVLAKLEGPLSPASLNIQFVNKSLGFIYGYSAIYAFYPVLFRTDDGGKTWQTIYAGGTGTPLRRSDLFMFNETKGIIVNNWNNEPFFHYMLTADGGKTWEQHRYKISRKDIRILNADGMLNEVYSEDGVVTIVFTNPDGGNRGSGVLHVIQSTDHGKTFRELK